MKGDIDGSDAVRILLFAAGLLVKGVLAAGHEGEDDKAIDILRALNENWDGRDRLNWLGEPLKVD